MIVRLTGSMVEAGSTRPARCPDCGGPGTATAVGAVTPAGVTVLASITECEACGDWWRCAFCREALALDGTIAFDHIASKRAVTDV